MGTLLGIMNSKAAALDNFLESMQDREIEVEDVAHVKKLRDVLKLNLPRSNLSGKIYRNETMTLSKMMKSTTNAKEIMKRRQLPLTST